MYHEGRATRLTVHVQREHASDVETNMFCCRCREAIARAAQPYRGRSGWPASRPGDGTLVKFEVQAALTIFSPY